MNIVLRVRPPREENTTRGIGKHANLAVEILIQIKGMGSVRVQEQGISSRLSKFLPEGLQKKDSQSKSGGFHGTILLTVSIAAMIFPHWSEPPTLEIQ